MSRPKRFCTRGWRNIYVDHLKPRPPMTEERLGDLVGKVKQIASIELVRETMGYPTFDAMPVSEYPCFAARLEGILKAEQAMRDVDQLIAYANGGKPEPTKETDMAITMTINADFSTFEEWVEFLKNLSFMGFMSKDMKVATPQTTPAPASAPVRAPVTPEPAYPVNLPSDTESSPISEQKVNRTDPRNDAATKREPISEPKAKRTRTRDKTPEEQILTLDDLSPLVDQANAAGISNEEIKAMIRDLGHISLTRMPQSDYYKFATALKTAIAAKK